MFNIFDISQYTYLNIIIINILLLEIYLSLCTQQKQINNIT